MDEGSRRQAVPRLGEAPAERCCAAALAMGPLPRAVCRSACAVKWATCPPVVLFSSFSTARLGVYAMHGRLAPGPLQVWAGATHFPDFFLPRARDYFTRLLHQHRELVPWDGIWVRVGGPAGGCPRSADGSEPARHGMA